MSKALLSRYLGKGCALIWGASCLGGTASIPRVHNTLNPGCFNFSKHLTEREKRVQEINASSRGYTKASFPWSSSLRSLDAKIGDAIGVAAMNNPCYEGVTSYGGFWNWTGKQGNGAKLDRSKKGSAFNSIIGCDAQSLEKLWPILKKWWEGTEFWIKGETKVQTYSEESKDFPKNWAKFFDWFWEGWDKVSEDKREEDIKKMMENGEKGDEWAKTFTTVPGIFEHVAVKVELTEADGDNLVGWSKCSSSYLR